MGSPTASRIYSKDQRFEVKPAGTDKYAQQIITAELIDWMDYIIVMEKNHRNKIRSRFADTWVRLKDCV